MNEPAAQPSDGPAPSSPPLALTVCLLVLACTTAAGAMAGGVLRMATATAGENAWSVVLQGLGIIVAGWLAGAVLWAAAWLVSRQHETLVQQARLAEAVRALAEARLPAATHAASPVPSTVVSLPAPLAPSRQDDAQKALLSQLAELNANLLLSDQERQAKRAEQAGRAVAELAGRVERAIEAGELTRAHQALEALLQQVPGDPRVQVLSDRLGREWSLQVLRAIERGDLPEALRKLDRMAQRFPGDSRLRELDDQIARAHVAAVERAVQGNDLAGANQALQRLRDRWAGRSEIASLQERIDRSGSSVRTQEIASHRRRIQELIAMAAFDKAEAAATELAQRHPESGEAKALLDLVRRDAVAFRMDRSRRLYADVEKNVETRQWRPALTAALRLLEEYPSTPEGDMLRAQLPTLEENARIEEVRELRDLIRRHIKAKRYGEALRVAQDVVKRFPGTQAASELGGQIVRLKELAFSSTGGS